MKRSTKPFFILLIALLALALPTYASAKTEVNPRGNFVGSDTCATCHQDVYDEWKVTRHANALHRLYTADNYSIGAPWGTEKEPKVISTSNSDRKYTLYMKGKEYWVTIHDKIDLANNRDYRIDAVGFTVQKMFFTYDEANDSLITLPFNYWNDDPKKERWGNAFDIWWFNEDGSIANDKLKTFNEFYNYENRCAECHVTGFYVQAWKDVPKLGRSADKTNIWTTTELAIGCEKCHGPGGEHVKSRDKKDIVNPENLVSKSGSEECDQCHQSGHAINYNNGFWNELPIKYNEENPLAAGQHYNVGDNLSDFYVHNVRKQWASTDYFQQSKSHTMQLLSTKHHENGLTCKTCHDPHKQQTRMPANDLCMSCHEDKGTVAHQGGSHKLNEVNCVDCHMPYGMISFLRSTRYDSRIHVFKPITPAESLAQFDYLKQFTQADADPEAKLTKSWAKIQANGECYDSYMYPNNVHYCTDLDVLPNACNSCHKAEFPKPGKFDDKERNKLVKAQERYEKLLKYQHAK